MLELQRSLLRICRPLALTGLLLAMSCAAAPPRSTTPVADPEPPPAKPTWVPVFDGEKLGSWEVISFGGEGETRIEDGTLNLHQGDALTGVRYTGDLSELMPESLENYELRLEACRERGTDFFCGLTFPVGKEGLVTFICGGWGGTVTGISCLDGNDASENDTTTYQRYQQGSWYRIRVRVTATEILCWIDDTQVVAVDRGDFERFHLRSEVEPTAPLGISTFMTHGAIRGVQIRRL